MLWVIGSPLGLDGSASAWLIRRFVDPSPCFRAVRRDEMPLVAGDPNGPMPGPAAAPGADDAGRWTASAGLRLIGQGFSLVASDEEILERSRFLYDALYAAVRLYPPVESRAARDARALAWFWLR